MAFPWLAAATIATPFINNFFGRGSERRERQYAQADYQQQRADYQRDLGMERAREDTFIQRRIADAKAAGLHPLTAMGSNVAAQSAQMFSGAISPTQAYRPHIDPAMFSNLALNQAQTEKLRAETDYIQQQATASKLAIASQQLTPDKVAGMELQSPKRTTSVHTPMGVVKTDPTISDAETAEDRWAEVVSNILGIVGFGRDVYHSNRTDVLDAIDSVLGRQTPRQSTRSYRRRLQRGK